MKTTCWSPDKRPTPSIAFGNINPWSLSSEYRFSDCIFLYSRSMREVAKRRGEFTPADRKSEISSKLQRGRGGGSSPFAWSRRMRIIASAQEVEFWTAEISAFREIRSTPAAIIFERKRNNLISHIVLRYWVPVSKCSTIGVRIGTRNAALITFDWTRCNDIFWALVRVGPHTLDKG